MRHRQGPAKKLAPSISSETVCPHIYAEEEMLQLEIDCSLCAGANDLMNNRCLTGVMNIIAAGAVPDSIILKRFIHKRYRGDSVRLAAQVSRELAALNRAIACTETPSDKKCRTCPSRRELALATLRGRLISDPRKYLQTSDERSRMASELIARGCEGARACVEDSLAASFLLSGGD